MTFGHSLDEGLDNELNAAIFGPTARAALLHLLLRAGPLCGRDVQAVLALEADAFLVAAYGTEPGLAATIARAPPSVRVDRREPAEPPVSL